MFVKSGGERRDTTLHRKITTEVDISGDIERVTNTGTRSNTYVDAH